MQTKKTTTNKNLLAALLMGANLIGALTPIAVLAIPNGYAHLGETALTQALDTLDSVVFSRASAQDYENENVELLGEQDTQLINDGKSYKATTVDGGTQTVENGTGTVDTMNSGKQDIYYNAIGTIDTMNGDHMNYGTQTINSNGTGTINTMNVGVQNILNGGTGTVTTMNSGSQTINTGGTGTIVTLNDGQQTIGNSGVGTVNTMYSGRQDINGGRGTIDTMNGGRQDVNGYGVGIVTTMNYGFQFIKADSSGMVDTMMDGARQVIESGGTGTVKNLNGGRQVIYDGGFSKDTVLNVGGTVYLNNGGIIDNITYNGGTLMLGGVTSGYDNMQLGQGAGESNVILNVNYGAIVKDLTINSSGKAILEGMDGYDSGQMLGNTVNHGLLDMSLADSGAFVENLSGIGGTVQVGLFYHKDIPVEYHNINITNLSGSQTFVINADLANNTADKVVIGNSATGTHYIKIDKEATAASALGGLTGHSATVVENAAGASFSGVQSAIDGINVLPTIEHDGSGNWNLVGYTVTGASNLAVTAAGAANNAYAALLAADNNIQRRMGELRDNQDSAGVWVRTFGGEYDVQGSTLKHTTIQGGYDKVTKVANGLSVTGITIEHLSGSSSYAHGDGKLTNTRMGIYHSWLGDSGHYYDVVVKTGKMYNELGAYDSTKISGHYRAWNTSISAEYGYRKQLVKGYFIQPQVELTLGRINGAGYTADNGTYINQDAINSLVARAGISIGQQLERGSYYLTASVLHEFSAKSKVTTGQGAFASTIEQDLKGTALELALGGNIKMGKNNNMYLEAARSFGGKTINKWQLQAGFRGNF